MNIQLKEKLELLFNNKYKVIAVILIIIVLLILLKGRKRESVVKPERAPLVEAIYALGTVKTDRVYNARFGMNSVIRKLYVREGDTVSAGSPLVLGDSAYPLTSPFTGVVTSRNYLESEMAPAGQVILTVSSMTALYVRVSLDQESILPVRKGQQAELSFENLRKERVSGIVEAVYQSGDEFVVRIACDRFPQGVLPQMTCDTAIILRRNDNALVVPSSAIKDGKALIIRNGKRMTVPVDSRKIDSKKAEILDSSILPDDRIIYTETPSAPRDGNKGSR